MTQVPYAIQITQALAVPAVALLAVVIGAMQWYTAHRKTILDLFDRRLEVYNAIRAAIAKVVQSGTCDDRVLFEFDQAVDRAPFLFGKAVTRYVEQLRVDLIELNLCSQMMNTAERQNFIQRRAAAFKKAVDFYSEFPAIIEPYISMHQKMIRLRFLPRKKHRR